MTDQEGDTRTSSARFAGCMIAVVAVLLPLLLAVIVLIVNNKPPHVTIPTHSVPKDNGLDYFTRATNMLGTLGPLSTDKTPDKWTDADYEAFMTSNAPALAELRRGLARQCVCPPQRGVDWLGALGPTYSANRELARTLRSAVMHYERRGEYGKAVDSHMDCIEMGVSLPGGSGQMGDLVGAAITAMGCSRIEDNLAHLNSSELARAAKRIERIQTKIVPYSEVTLEEGYVSASEYAGIFAVPETRSCIMNPLKWVELPGRLGSSSGSAPTDFMQGARLAFVSKTGLINQMLGYYKAFAVECGKPYTGKSSVPKPQNPLFDMLAENAARGRETHLRMETTIALIQTEIALRRCRADSGACPAKLALLVPKYLNSIPIDPFGVGKHLRYKPMNAGKSFVLYGLGANMTDDGGKPSPHIGDWREGDALLQNL